MAAGPWQFTDTGRTYLLNGTFDLDLDQFKVALHQSGSNIGAASTDWSGVTAEFPAGNGYTAGGEPSTGGTALELTGTTPVKVTESTPWQWTAGPGSITAKWAVLYEVAGKVLCYCLLDSGGADVTATNGNTLTVTANASGIFTLT